MIDLIQHVLFSLDWGSQGLTYPIRNYNYIEFNSSERWIKPNYT